MTRVLVSLNDAASTAALTGALRGGDLDLLIAADGNEAWSHLRADQRIAAAIFDWTLAGVPGPELCRRIRAHETHERTYVLLVTQRDRRDDLVAGLDAGADDYLIAPFDDEDLRARFQIGLRMRGIQETLRARAGELQAAASRITQLSGLLPICTYCKQIRTDQNYWEQLEDYLGQHTDLQFSHAICPDCYGPAADRLGAR